MTQENRHYFCSTSPPRPEKLQMPSWWAGSWNYAPPRLVFFLAGWLLINIARVSKRRCGYRALIQGCDYDYAFGHHLQIANMNTNFIGDAKDEGRACYFLLREQLTEFTTSILPLFNPGNWRKKVCGLESSEPAKQKDTGFWLSSIISPSCLSFPDLAQSGRKVQCLF